MLLLASSAHSTNHIHQTKEFSTAKWKVTPLLSVIKTSLKQKRSIIWGYTLRGSTFWGCADTIITLRNLHFFIGSKCWRRLIMTFKRIKLIRDVSLPIGVFWQNANSPRHLKNLKFWGSGLGNWEFLKAAFYILLISVSSLILITRICISLALKGVEKVNN